MYFFVGGGGRGAGGEGGGLYSMDPIMLYIFAWFCPCFGHPTFSLRHLNTARRLLLSRRRMIDHDIDMVGFYRCEGPMGS